MFNAGADTKVSPYAEKSQRLLSTPDGERLWTNATLPSRLTACFIV